MYYLNAIQSLEMLYMNIVLSFIGGLFKAVDCYNNDTKNNCVNLFMSNQLWYIP